MVGTALTLPGAAFAELIAEPFDFICVDLEHSALGLAEAQDLILGAQAVDTLAFVRLPRVGWETLLAPMLDAGADGIIAADVREAEHAKRLVTQLTHPPHGSRGVGLRRAGWHGRTTGAPPRRSRASLWVQIESREGVRAAREIAQVAGVDAVVPGCADLSYNLGAPLDLSSPKLREALATVRDGALAAGARFGLAGPLWPDPGIGELLAQASILMHATDARICAGAVDSTADRLRQLTKQRTGAPTK
jgi:4-hydroxy-2-oxoheptanedioate aldolase